MVGSTTITGSIRCFPIASKEANCLKCHHEDDGTETERALPRSAGSEARCRAYEMIEERRLLRLPRDQRLRRPEEAPRTRTSARSPTILRRRPSKSLADPKRCKGRTPTAGDLARVAWTSRKQVVMHPEQHGDAQAAGRTDPTPTPRAASTARTNPHCSAQRRTRSATILGADDDTPGQVQQGRPEPPLRRRRRTI